MALRREAVLDAEGYVLGIVMIDEAAAPTVFGALRDSDFAGEINRALFSAARSLYRMGEPVGPVTVLAKLGRQDDRDLRGYVAELINNVVTTENADAYVRLVREQATVRLINGLAIELASAHTLDGCAAPAAAIAEALGSGRRLEAWTMLDMLADFATRQSSEAKREYISIGLRAIDDNTYLERGDVMIIGGAPSDGKTAFALSCAYHMAQTLNVGFYSLETRRDKLEDRLVAAGFRIDFNAIKKSAMTEADWLRFNEQVPEASARRLTILHAAGMTAEQITGSARARGFDVIFIDYVQLVATPAVRGMSRADQMAAVSQALHTFAQSTGTLVVELAQLTRQERGSKRERDMFDLSESSQFEKDADLILLLYRPGPDTRFIEGDKTSEPLDPDRTRILRIAKQKEGKRVRLPLRFEGEYQSFSVLNENPYRAIERASREARKSRDTRKNQVSGQELIHLPPGEEGMPF